VDNGEVIAVDIPYATYAASQAYYREAFIAAIAAVSGRSLTSIYITNFQASSAGTTLIYFDTILDGTDYDVAAAAAAVQSLFVLNDTSCAATTPVGCPAHIALTNAMVGNGLPAAAAFYNDQLVASIFVPAVMVRVAAVAELALRLAHASLNSLLSAQPIDSAAVGTWQFADSNEVLALDILYSTYGM